MSRVVHAEVFSSREGRRGRAGAKGHCVSGRGEAPCCLTSLPTLLRRTSNVPTAELHPLRLTSNYVGLTTSLRW